MTIPASGAAGNNVTRGSRNVVWDGAGRPKQVWRASDGALYGSYRYDPLGRRVKKTWNYPNGSGQQLTGSELYVYGAGGEILVEYRSESGQWYGAQTTTSYNIMLGGQAVARRATGTSEVLGPIDRVDRLYRNHLGGVVLDASTPYAQPFGSGGSDQFAGHKDDRESGMKYFGARYYHATSARWISADSILVHAHDPQSLNKYGYVRNDPDNKVDADGRSWHYMCYGSGEDQDCHVWWEDDPLVLAAPWMPAQLDAENPPEPIIGGGGSWFKLPAEKLAILERIALSEPCKRFLESVIKALGAKLKGKEGKAFDIAQLLENIGNANIENTNLGPGVYEKVEGNLIKMAPDAYKLHYYAYDWGGPIMSRPGDEYTVYLHAGFHLQMSSASGSMLRDKEIYDALLKKDVVREIPSLMPSAMLGLAFATNCGPRVVQRP